MAAPSVDKIVESFENPNIPLINREVTYATLHAMHELLNSNAESVSTNLGWIILGHLCLNLSPTVYATLSTTRVVPPLNPGATPVIPAERPAPKQHPSDMHKTWRRSPSTPSRTLTAPCAKNFLAPSKTRSYESSTSRTAGIADPAHWIC